MTAINKQFFITVLAGVTTMAFWELVIKRNLKQEPAPKEQSYIDRFFN